MKPNRLLMGVAMAIRQLYLPLKIRMRQWGALPPGRGPVVLITNHQFMDEGEIVVSRTFLRHPWKPLVMVNSRRTFETGFFAARLPWTAPLTRTLNPSGLWLRLSILPVENHLFSRTLTSLAEEIRATHGNVALDAVLAPEVTERLGLAGRRLDELWSPALFPKAQATIKLARLNEPYRREALENFRATAARDVAAIVERVRNGATFYVTPEGDFSRDGRMHPLRRGLLDPVLPYAAPWLCAIAYDPFRGRRLPMLYRILQPADPNDLHASLGAARPVTTSAVLATVVFDSPHPLAEGDIVARVAALVAALPPACFVDPELRRAPAAVTREALANLERRGTLARSGERYRLTDVRRDARFPHVADMVAYQRAMLDETTACARRLAADAPVPA